MTQTIKKTHFIQWFESNTEVKELYSDAVYKVAVGKVTGGYFNKDFWMVFFPCQYGVERTAFCYVKRKMNGILFNELPPSVKGQKNNRQFATKKTKK